MPTCPSCRTSISDTAMRFCPWCGSPLPAAARREGNDEAAQAAIRTAPCSRAAKEMPSEPTMAGAHPRTDYDDAVRIGRQIEWISSSMATPISIGMFLVITLVAAVYPIVWAIVALYVVTACGADIKRRAARRALREHDVARSKAAISTARIWYAAFVALTVTMVAIEVWALFRVADFLKRGM